MVEYLKKLALGQSLNASESQLLMHKILNDELVPEQIGAFLIALHCKGETSAELVGFTQALRQSMIEVTPKQKNAIDVCGTGGDGLGTFNVSTCVAFVVAAAGVPVAKHGNRAVSSRSGSSDVLNELGIASSQTASEAQLQLTEFNLTFMLAPSFHPVLQKVSNLRKNLGVRTAFNLLGPLLNPARVSSQLLGVSKKEYILPMAEALMELGSQEAMVVCGEGGLDEFSVTGPTQVAHLKDKKIRQFEITPDAFGINLALPSALAGGDSKQNSQIIISILSGEKSAKRDIVVLNAAAALVIGQKCSDLKEGLERSQSTIDSGAALNLVKRMQDFDSFSGRVKA